MQVQLLNSMWDLSSSTRDRTYVPYIEKQILFRDENYPQEKEMQKNKMAIWGGLTNSYEKKRSKKQSINTVNKQASSREEGAGGGKK